MGRGGCASFAQVALVDCDDLEGRQVQVGEAGILQVVEVPLRQGVPAAGTAACHRASQQPPPPPSIGQPEPPSPHLLSLVPRPAPSIVGDSKACARHPPLRERSHRASGSGTSLRDRVPSCRAAPYLRPLSCDFRLCSNRAASLKDTRRPVELVDRKRSVSASWPSGSSPLKSGSARRAERVGPGRAAPGAGRAAGRGGAGRGGGEGRGPAGAGRARTHPLTHSLAQHAPASTYARALRKQR